MKTSEINNTESFRPSIQEYFLTKDLPGPNAPATAELHLTNLGATIMGLSLPLASGDRDVILGFDKPEDYLVQDGNLGGLIGRVAGRLPAGPEGYPVVKIAGQTHPISANSGTTCLHGGEPGFHRELWELAAEGQDETRNWLTFRLVSSAGDAGFPGDLEVHVTYSLETPPQGASQAAEGSPELDNELDKKPKDINNSCLDLHISYQASCSAPTVCSLTQHAYFNLQGHDRGNLLGQKLQVSADHYTNFTQDLIATGEICSLEGTILDLRHGQDLGQILRQGLGQVASAQPGKLNQPGLDQIASISQTGLNQPGLESRPGQPSPTGTRLYLVDQPDPHLTVTRGLDHNYILSQEAHGPLQKVARLFCDDLSMEVLTTFPGLQVYTANYLDTLGKAGKDGQPTPYPPHSAVCLECQAWPNAANLARFPSIYLEPGQVYQQETIYRFRIS